MYRAKTEEGNRIYSSYVGLKRGILTPIDPHTGPSALAGVQAAPPEPV